MTLGLSVDEVLTTTRAVRKRLDLERPVPRALIEECLELALQAPSGSNSQGWHFLFISDPEKKRALADIYGRNFDVYAGAARPSYAEGDTRGERMGRVIDSATHLRRHFHEVPWMMIPMIEADLSRANPAVQAGAWGSLLPAVWSFMLAARERGLGTAWTTLHLAQASEAAELLGIDDDRWTQGGLFPIAYTRGTDFRPAPRLALESVASFETFGRY